MSHAPAQPSRPILSMIRLGHIPMLLVVSFLFLLDVFVADPVPWIDEIVLGLMTVILGTKWRDKPRRAE